MAILAHAWPSDLDPKRVPFQRRTITTLQRMGAWDDRTRFEELTVAEVAGFWVTGPVTVADLVSTSEEAIGWHRAESTHKSVSNRKPSRIGSRPYRHICATWHGGMIDVFVRADAIAAGRHG